MAVRLPMAANVGPPVGDPQPSAQDGSSLAVAATGALGKCMIID
ncbi:MAG: hypothetical protein O7D91_04330 [Planctomycetota bacterium]|nr:hypothetical protein [Planctomycetota bacterium]